MKCHWNKLFGIVDDTWEYDGASLRLYPESLWRCRRRRVDVIIGRLGEDEGCKETGSWKSMALCRVSVLPCGRAPIPDGITFFVILVTCISLSWPILPRLRRPRISFSFVFTQSRRKNFHSIVFPLVDQYLMILLNIEIVNNYLWKRHVIERVNVISELEISR